MNRIVTALLDAAWKLAMLGLLAVGVQAVGNNQPPAPPAAQSDQPPVAETARLGDASVRRGDSAALTQQVKVQQDKATDHVPGPLAADANVGAGPKAMTYGPNGTFITLDEYYRLHPQASPRYRSPKPRPRWRYRPPTCTPSRAQIAWARMLPNYDGLRGRGLSDQQIIQSFAPSEVKALESDEVPEHLRPDLNPGVVYINERCVDGTCRTGYCEASRRNLGCKDGFCPMLKR